MARYNERQTSFAKGELAPGMRGRTDHASYAHGCRTLKNFFATPHGGASNRPGTEHIDITVGGGEYKCQEIPFIASDLQACVVCIEADPGSEGNTGTVKFILNGAPVGPTLTYPCTAAQLSSIGYSQVGDVIVLVHPEIPPYELKRLSSDFTSWSIAEVSFAVPAFPGYGGTPVLTDFYPEDETHPAREWSWCLTRIMQVADGRMYQTAPFTITKQARQPVFNWDDLGRNGHGVNIADDRNDPRYEGTAYMAGDIVWCSGANSNTGGYFQAQQSISAEYNSVNGPEASAADSSDWWVELSLPPYDPISGRQVVYADRAANIRWDGLYAPVTPGTAEQDRIISTRIYRGRNGRYGLVGETTQTWFLDEGGDPNYSYPPPQQTNPFEVRGGDGVLIRTEEPSVVSHWNGRRFYANTAERPDWLWGSEVQNYYNHDVVLKPKDSDALSFHLGTNKMEAIRALIPRSSLVILTDSSEHIAGGAGDSLMTPTSISALPLSEHGCGELAPLVFGDVIVFMQRKGTFPRALIASTERGGFLPVDIHSDSRHFFTGHTIVAWCYAEDPHSLIWAVRDDGALLSCAFNLEQRLAAWSIHWLAAGGLAEDVCSIPEGQEDVVYVVALRGGTRRIERMTSRAITDVRDACIIDAAVRYDGRNTDSTHLASLTATGSLDVGAEVIVSVEEATEGMYLNKVLRITIDGATVDTLLISSEGPSAYVGQLLDAIPLAMSGATTADWSICVDRIAGLGHLASLGQEDADYRNSSLKVHFTGDPGDYGQGDTITLGVDAQDGHFVSGAVMYLVVDGVTYCVEIGSPIDGDTFEAEVLALDIPASALEKDSTDWWIPTTAVSFTSLRALLDGCVYEDLQIVGSSVVFRDGDIPHWAAVVSIGLQYDADFESLDVAPERTKKKTVGTVHIETEGSRGGYVGVTLDDLEEIPQRDVEDAYSAIPLQYESIKVNIPSRWNESGRVAFRQTAPLPITILGITREVEVGG